MFLNKSRYLIWFILEKFKKDSVLNRKKEITYCMENDEYYKKYKCKKVEEICSYASKNTTFYKKYEGKKINDFPVINKNILMSQIDDFKSKEYQNKKLHIMATSGSTGIPFKIEQDSHKRKQVLAEIIYFSELIGYKVGSKIVYLRNLESMFKVSKLKQFIKNEEIIATQKYDDETLKKIIKHIINLKKGTIILGYASTLQMLASCMEKYKIEADNIVGIISGAEAITTKTRFLVEKQFKCPVVSRYSNQEMGILAQDSQEDKFLLNRASYNFEILDLKEDKPVLNGEIGRIIITDFYNHAVPLIRYDTGDLGILKIDENGHEYLAKVYGRKLDLLYTTKDEPISFFALDEYFEDNFDIEQFQIIQETRTHLIINLIMKENKVVDQKWCISKVKKVMGDDCEVEIRYLDQLPITNSGKFRYVICNYHPSQNKI